MNDTSKPKKIPTKQHTPTRAVPGLYYNEKKTYEISEKNNFCSQDMKAKLMTENDGVNYKRSG